MKNNTIKLFFTTLIFAFSISVSVFAGWEQDGGDWKYKNEDGSYKQTGWYKDESGKWYYFKDGMMKTGWVYTSDGKYYYQLSSGESATGWLQIDGKWYYFNADNTMHVGTMTVGSVTYYFADNGICTNPGGSSSSGNSGNITIEHTVIEIPQNTTNETVSKVDLGLAEEEYKDYYQGLPPSVVVE